MKLRLRTRKVVEETLIADHTRSVVRFRGSSVTFDGADLHRDPEARILTDEPEIVCLLLGIPYPDPQVIRSEQTNENS